MKHIAYSLVVVAATSLSSIAVAGPNDSGDSVLSSQNETTYVNQAAEAVGELGAGLVEPPQPIADPADMIAPQADHSAMPSGQADAMDAPMAPSDIPQPVVDNTVTQGQPVQQHVGHVHTHHAPVRHYRPKKKQNVFQKMMELERRKNAWLKKTFLGM